MEFSPVSGRGAGTRELLGAPPERPPPAPPPEAGTAVEAAAPDSEDTPEDAVDDAKLEASDRVEASKKKKVKKKRKPKKGEDAVELEDPLARLREAGPKAEAGRALQNHFSRTAFAGLEDTSDSGDEVPTVGACGPAPAWASGKEVPAAKPPPAAKANPAPPALVPPLAAKAKPAPPALVPPSAVQAKPAPPAWVPPPAVQAKPAPSVWVPPPAAHAKPAPAAFAALPTARAKPAPPVLVPSPAAGTRADVLAPPAAPRLASTQVPKACRQPQPPPAPSPQPKPPSALQPAHPQTQARGPKRCTQAEAADPLPQRSAARPPGRAQAPTMLNGGLAMVSSDYGSAATGYKWAVRPVERLASGGYYEEEEDPELARYLWDRKVQRPKNDLVRAVPRLSAPPIQLVASRPPPQPPVQRQRALLFQVMEMGFDEPSSKRALTSTGWAGVEEALTLLLGS